MLIIRWSRRSSTMITQDFVVVRSGDWGSQGRLNDLLDTRTSSSDFRDTVVEVEISLGSYDGQFNLAILVSVASTNEKLC